MPERSRKKKSPSGGMKAASGIVAAVTQDAELTMEQAKEAAHAAAIALGRLGGLKGGKAPAAKLSNQRKRKSPARPLMPAGKQSPRSDG